MIRILLVEDDPVIRDTTSYFLKSQQNFEVVCADTGGEALSHAREKFDVILMDVMMPEMNGYEATKAIRAMNDRPDGKNIPIIAMTANSFAEDVQASLDAGMNAHLSKPIVIEEVIKTILRYVHND